MEIILTSTAEDKISLVEKLKKKVDSNPESPVAHMKLGTALLQAGRTTKAVQELEKAISLDPKCVPALVNLGGVLLGRWDFAGCVEMNRRAAAAAPEVVEAHYNQGLGHLYLEQKEEMIACFKRVVDLDDSNAGGHYYLAVGFLALQKEKEARSELAIALGLGYKPEPEFLKALEGKADKDRRLAPTKSETKKNIH
jgi:tetratricopeptide (TPR) repeat protein